MFQDVPGLGRDGEVLAVKPGRARNHLVPGRMAAYATPDRLPEAAERRAAWAEESALTEQTDEDGGEAVRDVNTAVQHARGFSVSSSFSRRGEEDGVGSARSSRRALVRDAGVGFLSLYRRFGGAAFHAFRLGNETTR